MVTAMTLEQAIRLIQSHSIGCFANGRCSIWADDHYTRDGVPHAGGAIFHRHGPKERFRRSEIMARCGGSFAVHVAFPGR